jgi:hypothetical protein
VAEGLSNEGIGDRLHISPKTVEANIHQIFMKLDLRDDPGGLRRVAWGSRRGEPRCASSSEPATPQGFAVVPGGCCGRA